MTTTLKIYLRDTNGGLMPAIEILKREAGQPLIRSDNYKHKTGEYGWKFSNEILNLYHNLMTLGIVTVADDLNDLIPTIATEIGRRGWDATPEDTVRNQINRGVWL